MVELLHIPPACNAMRSIAGRHMSRYFYTYVLKSKIDGNLYIGWTVDLRKRVKLHNKGLVTSTKDRKPLQLVYYEACLSKENAILREKALKTGFGRAYLKRRLNIIPR